MAKFTSNQIAEYIIESTNSMYEDGNYYVHWSKRNGLNYLGNSDPDNFTVVAHCGYAESLDQYEFYQKENLNDRDFMFICKLLAGKLNKIIERFFPSKKLYYVRTNAYDMLVTYDHEEKIVRFLNSIDVHPFLGHLDKVEDDSSWEMAEDVEDLEEWLGIGSYDHDETSILETVDFEQFH